MGSFEKTLATPHKACFALIVELIERLKHIALDSYICEKRVCDPLTFLTIPHELCRTSRQKANELAVLILENKKSVSEAVEEMKRIGRVYYYEYSEVCC